MKMLTLGQLNYLLDQLYSGDVKETISETEIQKLFDDYGDTYFRDHSLSGWELSVENASWKNGRGKYSWIPRSPYSQGGDE